MSCQPYTEATADAIDSLVIRQYARYLRLQARYLEEDGDWAGAAELRKRAATGVGHGGSLQ